MSRQSLDNIKTKADIQKMIEFHMGILTKEIDETVLKYKNTNWLLRPYYRKEAQLKSQKKYFLGILLTRLQKPTTQLSITLKCYNSVLTGYTQELYDCCHNLQLMKEKSNENFINFQPSPQISSCWGNFFKCRGPLCAQKLMSEESISLTKSSTTKSLTPISLSL